jgi:hypothetical protein
LVRDRAAGRLETFREIPDRIAVKSLGAFELTYALVYFGLDWMRATDIAVVQRPVVLKRCGRWV